MKLFFEDSWQSLKKRIDWNKLSQLCADIFSDSEVEDVREYANFKYKDNYLLVKTVLDGFIDANKEDQLLNRDESYEKEIKKNAKSYGIGSRIAQVYHRDRFDVITAIEVDLKVPYDLIMKETL